MLHNFLRFFWEPALVVLLSIVVSLTCTVVMLLGSLIPGPSPKEKGADAQSGNSWSQ